MQLDHFQVEALKTAIYPQRGTKSEAAIAYASLGLAEEAGEVAGKIKRVFRGDFELNDETREIIAKELGDVLWYLSALSFELGYSLNEIAELNLLKIKDRVEKGTQRGSGDDR